MAVDSVITPRDEALRGHLAMLAFSALIAGSFSLGGMVANEIAPAALNSVRFFIASVLIGSLSLIIAKPSRADFTAPWRYAVLGTLFATYFVLMFEGLKTAPPVSSAAMFTLTPAMSAVFGYLILRQITTPRMALALSIGGAGALWVIFRADLGALMAFEIGTGESIFFWGCVAHAIYPTVARGLSRGEHYLTYTFGMLVAGFIALTAWGWSDIWATDWSGLRPLVWVTIGYTSVFAGATTFTLLQFASLRLPSAKVMAYTYLTPTWVILWEVALGHGAPSGLILLGVALTVVALALLLKNEH
ncbi:MAG: DMT family transporter [Rhodobacteraceae bacterium]|nr:DMT family transporter [Paracoccaceae bacterium]